MHADIREDLVAIVQLLMVVVLGGRGRKPFTEAEGKKLYSDAVLTMYAHLDSMGRTMHEGGDDSSSEDEGGGGFADLLERYRREEGAKAADDDLLACRLVSEEDDSGRGGRALCIGAHATGPLGVGSKQKCHLVQQ